MLQSPSRYSRSQNISVRLGAKYRPRAGNRKGATFFAAPFNSVAGDEPGSVAGHQPMRVAIEVLGGKLKQLGVLDRFHLMHQSNRNVHAFAGDQLKLLERLALRRF